jgi:hypothetical protein
MEVRTRTRRRFRSALLRPPNIDMSRSCRFGIGVDGTTDFGYPELHAPVGELGEDVLHLTS